MDKKLNGFNNSRDTTDGVGGRELPKGTYIVSRDPYSDNNAFYPKIEDVKQWTQAKELTLWQKIKKLWNTI